MGGRNKKKINKEEIAESYCFVCKDGGLLRVCDYKDCVKVYHPQCVKKDDSFLESNKPWHCQWHFCFICKTRKPKFHCFCCPMAVCGCCFYDANFPLVGQKKGFCSVCLTLTGLIEGVKDPDPKEEMIDFSDENTYEYFFKHYWETTKIKEGLNSEIVRAAVNLLKAGKNHHQGSDLNVFFNGEEGTTDTDENQDYSDCGDSNYAKYYQSHHNEKRNKRKRHAEVKSKKMGFVGWGSKALFDFFSSIGKETTQQLSQYEVADIIIGYCKENKLFHPAKKKLVLCDAKLYSLLGRKSVSRNSIGKYLAAHFFENLEQSENEFEHFSEYDVGNVLMESKKQQNSSSERKPEKKLVAEVQYSCFASVISENIKRIYLRKSVLEELLMQPDTFEAKVIRSFVRVKCDPNDFLQRSSHQLLQVTGIKKAVGTGEMKSNILLQVSYGLKDFSLCELSDAEFSEEEIQDLQRNVKEGLIKRLTVVEVEEKARSLHEIITKHWIDRELVLLQNQINRTNEKGWRRELSIYMDKMLQLRKPEEQARLLHEVPKIIADELEVEPTSEDWLRQKIGQEHGGSLEIASRGDLQPLREISQVNESYGCENDRINAAESKDFLSKKSNSVLFAPGYDRSGEASSENSKKHAKEEKQLHKGTIDKEQHPMFHSTVCEGIQDAILQTGRPNAIEETKQAHFKESHYKILAEENFNPVSQRESEALIPRTTRQPGNGVSVKEKEAVVIEDEQQQNKQNQEQTETNVGGKAMRCNGSGIELIELSDDEEQVATGVVCPQQRQDDLSCPIWYIMGPRGITKGPYPMSLLTEWNNSNPYSLSFKVWKLGQSPEEAVLLTDAIRQVFSQTQ